MAHEFPTGSACDVEPFLAEAKGPIFDVRSPCEFMAGHIPGSISLPLFTDDERASVGTAYKRRGHDEAVDLGLSFVGPKLADMSQTVRTTLGSSTASSCRVTCFRGGMRSRSVQWLCELLGFSTVRLEGGYKYFRRHVLQTFARPYRLLVIGGPTGSGKTQWISKLKEEGYQAIDLEGLAAHRGSAFGLLPGVVQPTTEQFENCLAQELWTMDPSQPIFVEDESRMIGTCVIPKPFYDQMDQSHLVWLQVSEEERVEHIMACYGGLPLQWLIDCTRKLQRRLGLERMQETVSLIESGRIAEAAKALLVYYDQAYLHSRSRHSRECSISSSEALLQTIQPLLTRCP